MTTTTVAATSTNAAATSTAPTAPAAMRIGIAGGR